MVISDVLEREREREATFVPLGQWFHGWLRRLRHECGDVCIKELSGAVIGCIDFVSVTLCFALPTGACATCGVRNTSDWRGRH